MPSECQELVIHEMDDISDIVNTQATPRQIPRTPRSARSARSAASFAHQGHPHPRVAQTPRKRGGRRMKRVAIHEDGDVSVDGEGDDETGASEPALPVIRKRCVRTPSNAWCSPC